MKRSYYLFNPGRLSRKDNTLKFQPIDEDGKETKPRYLPIETIETIYCFGSLDANSALYNFLGKQGVSVHFFDYYEHYTGSFYPKEYLLAGKLQVQQTLHYCQPQERQLLAQQFIEGASFNMLKNLKYYHNRGKELETEIETITALQTHLSHTTEIPELMGVEGNIRIHYYKAFEKIAPQFPMNGRSYQPPKNEMNALISFVNMLCYTLVLDQLYHTQLNPTISFLHEPGTRRFSLALDIAEVFKPLLVDRLLFSLINKKIIQPKHFQSEVNSCLLKPSARKIVLQHWDSKLKDTIKHRTLGRSVSYKHLVKLECYKLTKHLMQIEPYKPFKAWW